MPRPEAQFGKFVFQGLDAAGGMVGNPLGGVPFLFGTGQLLAQLRLLPPRPGKTQFQRRVLLRMPVRQRLQGVGPALQFRE
ncbi:hypothetical protein [Streptomyces rubiginosohelvolus]